MGVKFGAVDRLESIVLDHLSGPAAQAALVQFARGNLAAAIASGEGSDQFETIVNGRRGAAESSVQMPGPIVYQFSWMPDVVASAFSFLRQRYTKRNPEPDTGGHYADSHFIMQNGKKISIGEIVDGVEVVISNDQPYSRKMQLGSTGYLLGKGIYSEARQYLVKRWSNLVRVDMSFIQLAGGHVLESEKSLRYPALIINRAD
jgi:hypothetical protein